MRMIIALVSLFSSVTYAAPFCAVFSYGKQCYYYDMSSCQAAAGTSGACVTNDEDTKPASGLGKFCVVTSYATECYYYDAESCRQAAARANGVCKVKTN